MLDTFHSEVRRIANLLAYEQPIDAQPRLLVAAAQLYLHYQPFTMPEEPSRYGASASGEFTAR